MDVLSSSQRSALMARIRGKNTKPEMMVRRMAHGMGYRYRLHKKSLPGTPDLVFASRKKVIFVNGCFWHRHAGCQLAATPKTRVDFWMKKLDRNVQRDKDAIRQLEQTGWQVLVIWECETRSPEGLDEKLAEFLG